jgi:hypothetical protein
MVQEASVGVVKSGSSEGVIDRVRGVLSSDIEPQLMDDGLGMKVFTTGVSSLIPAYPACSAQFY